MIRERSASACAVVRLRTKLSSCSRCSALITNAAFGRPVRIVVLLLPENETTRDIVLLITCQDTSRPQAHDGHVALTCPSPFPCFRPPRRPPPSPGPGPWPRCRAESPCG